MNKFFFAALATALVPAILMAQSAPSLPTTTQGVVGAAPKSLSVIEMSKTDVDVLRDAQANRTQQVFVLLDSTDIDAEVRRRAEEITTLPTLAQTKEESKRLAKDIEDKRRAAIKDLKDRVFSSKPRTSFRIIEDYTSVSEIFVEISDFTTLKDLLADPRVLHIEKPKPLRMEGGNDLQIIGQGAAVNSFNAQGGNTKIAVLDSAFSNPASPAFSTIGAWPACRGVNYYASAGDLWGTGHCRVHEALNFSAGISPPPEADLVSSTNHGTAVAEIAATVAPKSQISYLQIYDSAGNGNTSYLRSALNWVANNQYAEVPIVAVNISSSYGSLTSSYCLGDPLTTYVLNLVNSGIVVVTASGDDGKLNAVRSPSCIPATVSVGSSTDSAISPINYSTYGLANCVDGALPSDAVPCFSNGGTLVSLLAPGVQISTPEVYSSTGTSFSAPHVAGAVAILKGTNAYPLDTVPVTVTRMTATGKLIPRAGTISIPRLQIDKALAYGGTQTSLPNPCKAHPTWCN